jgi:hypothetical protein
MLNFLRKYWTLIFIALIIITLSTLFIWPAIIPLLAWFITIAGTGVVIVFTVTRHYRKYLQDHHSRIKLVRNAGLDVLGILLTIGSAIWLAGVIAGIMVPVVTNAVESMLSGMGTSVGIIIGVIISLGIGFGVGLLVRWISRKLMARLN